LTVSKQTHTRTHTHTHAPGRHAYSDSQRNASGGTRDFFVFLTDVPTCQSPGRRQSVCVRRPVHLSLNISSSTPPPPTHTHTRYPLPPPLQRGVHASRQTTHIFRFLLYFPFLSCVCVCVRVQTHACTPVNIGIGFLPRRLGAHGNTQPCRVTEGAGRPRRTGATRRLKFLNPFECRLRRSWFDASLLFCLFVCLHTCAPVHMRVVDLQILCVREKAGGAGRGKGGSSVTRRVCIAARCEQECDVSECSGCSRRPAPLSAPLSPSHAPALPPPLFLSFFPFFFYSSSDPPSSSLTSHAIAPPPPRFNDASQRPNLRR